MAKKYINNLSSNYVEISKNQFKNEKQQLDLFEKNKKKVLSTKRKDDDYLLVIKSNRKSLKSDLKFYSEYLEL